MDEDLIFETATIGMSHEDLPQLTRQELEFVAGYVASNNSVSQAAKRAGMSLSYAKVLAKKPHIQEHIEYQLARFRQATEEEITYTLKDAHVDIEMGKRMAATAGEWFKGVELHMKLHGLMDRKQEVTVNINQIDSREKIQELDDEQLIKLAGFSFSDLLPEAIEGEIVDQEAK